MHIAMISEHASPLAAVGGVDAGGQNVHVAALAEGLARRRHRVTVYTRRDDAALPDRVTIGSGVEVVHVDAGPAKAISKDKLLPFMGDMGQAIGRDFQRIAPTVVHGHFWMSGLAAVEARRVAGLEDQLPFLQTFHALGSVKRRHQAAADTSPPERLDLERAVGRSATTVLATCTEEVFELRAMGVTGDRIAVVPCGVDARLFTPEGPTQKRSDAIRVACIGRLVPRKGVDLVLRAIARLRAEGGPSVELVIAGGPGDREATLRDEEAKRLMSLAAQLGVTDAVTWRGQVPHNELPALMRSVDVVACTPWYEPFGIVPLEAMAAGVPVVATATGGLKDTVIHQRTGLHVPPQDEEALAEALGMLAARPELRSAFGAAGRERVLQRYTWERVAEQTERAYVAATSKSIGTAAVPRLGATAVRS